MANIRAVQNGNYSNSATWAGGAVPIAGDIACCGTFRVTLNTSPLAAISTANLDWVAGGGAALSTSHSGGFDIPDGATIVIPLFRYGMDRDIGFTSANAGLAITNGTITITETRWVDGALVMPVIAAVPSNTLVLNIGTSKLSSTPNAAASWYLLHMHYYGSASVTMTFGDIIPATGTVVGMPFMRAFGEQPTSLDITFTGVIYSNAQYATIGHSGITPGYPVGTSRCRFLSNQIGLGTGEGGIISINYFKNVEFSDLSLLGNSLSGIYGRPIECGAISNSIVVNSAITSNIRGQINFNGTASLTVNGNISRIYRAGVGITQPFMDLNYLLGDIIINGDIIQDGSAEPQSIAGMGVLSVGDANVTVGNIINISATAASVVLYLDAPGKTLTVNGDVDCSAVVVSGISAERGSIGIYCYAAVTQHIVVTGNVKGFDSPTSTVIYSSMELNNRSAAIMATPAHANPQSLTVNGSVFAGRASPGIIVEGSINFPFTVKKVVSGTNLLSTRLAPPAIQTTIQTVVTDELDFGVEGRFPITGYVKFRNAAAAIVTGRNADNSPCVLVEQPSGLVVIAANVRSGITIGSTVGTLNVPLASTVQSGVIYDNGTVGTLTTGGGATDITALTASVAAIKAKTDQLTYGVTGVISENNINYTSRFNSVDTSLANLIADNMRNTLVAGVVSSTNFIGLLNSSSTEITGGSPAYVRQGIVWSTPFNGIVTNTTAIHIDVPTGVTVVFIAGYSASMGGVAEFTHACTPVTSAVQSIYTIPIGTLQMTTTVV